MIIHGDCREELPRLTQQFHAVICDPPYNLASIQKRFGASDAVPAKHGVFARTSRGFMGCKWDDEVAFDPETWRLVYDRLLPGAHLIAFGGTRTHHRMWCAIEDAGFELRDTIMWVYGSGFPKSHDVSKGIDKHLGAERTKGAREWSGGRRSGGICKDDANEVTTTLTKYDTPATPEAAQWDGWGTALKPSMEMICLARKPLSEKTVAANVLKHGTGAINIDGCRVPADDSDALLRNWDRETLTDMRGGRYLGGFPAGIACTSQGSALGRWPANLVLSPDPDVLAMFPQSKSTAQPRHNNARPPSRAKGADCAHITAGYDDEGSSARFFAQFERAVYCPKASKAERGEGNHHSTVKPIKLLQYLCRLITPPGGRILDPFAGSGSTGVAAQLEGFEFVGIELEAEYVAIAEKRVTAQALPDCITF